MPDALHPSLASEVQKLEQDAEIHLFELDYSMLPGEGSSEPFRFHAGPNELGAQVIFDGKAYMYLPCQADGFEWSQGSTLPHPNFTVANVGGALIAALREHGDLVACKLTRIRTLAKHLDAVNFPGGVNPNADPSATYAPDLFEVLCKADQSTQMIKWELAPIFEVQGRKLPKRVVVNYTCTTKYRSPECGYTGAAGWFDANDQPVALESQDVCSQRLSGCRCRFPEGLRPAPVIVVVWEKSSDAASIGRSEPGIPFGGFPGAGLTR